MSDDDAILHFQYIYAEDDISQLDNILIIKYIQDFEGTSLAAGPSRISHNRNHYDTLQRDRGDPTTIELSSAQDACVFLMS